MARLLVGRAGVPSTRHEGAKNRTPSTGSSAQGQKAAFQTCAEQVSRKGGGFGFPIVPTVVHLEVIGGLRRARTLSTTGIRHPQVRGSSGARGGRRAAWSS